MQQRVFFLALTLKRLKQSKSRIEAATLWNFPCSRLVLINLKNTREYFLTLTLLVHLGGDMFWLNLLRSSTKGKLHIQAWDLPFRLE